VGADRRRQGTKLVPPALAGVLLAFPWLLVGLAPTVEAQQATVELGIANTGDLRARDIIIKKGLSEDEILTLMRAWRAEESASVQKVEELAGKLAVNQAAVTNFLRILDEQNVPDDRILIKLAEIASRHLELVDRLTVLESDSDPAGAALADARTAIEIGDYDRADALLARAEEADLAAARSAEELARQATAAAERRFLLAASRRAERGELSLIRLNYLEAAEHFKTALELVPAAATNVRGDYLCRYAGARYQHGDQKGDNAALREAVAAYRAALEERTRERVPLDWAMTQNSLGNALSTLGERERDTATIEEAVGAYRAALEEWTRERVPLDWAMTQNNLGNALSTLGARESGIARLEEAVAAYRAALEEWTRERVPLDWARTQNNLGTVLSALGARESGTARLEEAVAAYRTALEERTRERVPLDWALIQNNLGNALSALGERESGTARLEQAITGFRAALEEWTRDRVPLQWAATQNNLGSALYVLGAREGGTAKLEEAVVAFRAALEERSRERLPLAWAQTQNNLGTALLMLGERARDLASLRDALTAVRNAYELLVKEAGYLQYEAYFAERLDRIQSAMNAMAGC
jgi:tetratricopeptide (TPR) repeat protein